MSHLVESMFSANNERPWHNLGTVIDKPGVTSKEAIKAAGLDWNVYLSPLYTKSETGKEIKTCIGNAVVRDKDNKVLGIVGNRYKPFQNYEAFDFMDEVMNSNNAHFETAGSLKGGKIIWALAKLDNEIEIIDKDRHESYLLISTSHDGTSSIMLTLTSIRVVCNNTLTAAIKGMSIPNTFRMRHTENYRFKIDEARKILGIAPTFYKEMELFLKRLKEKPLGRDQMENISKKIFEVDTKNTNARAQRNAEKLTNLFVNGIGNNHPEIRNTAYAALNAAIEFDSFHFATRGAENQEEVIESRMNRIWFNRNKTIQTKMINMLSTL